jgi:methylphosphotriester-DNA--protein-cysteine methyltransferase
MGALSESGQSGNLARGIPDGVEAISAVVTTGIYCRPGCSARPRVENVRTFPLAAAAEAAGYRACLRCRPYRRPQSIGWTAPELVCRAVRLILDGALDRGSEAALGARLGMSPRHLRRLFTAHLGVTPDGLARSARVHFARRLLDDTDLTMTEIAFAAGFGSLRQFNRACREVFRESPPCCAPGAARPIGSSPTAASSCGSRSTARSTGKRWPTTSPRAQFRASSMSRTAPIAARSSSVTIPA